MSKVAVGGGGDRAGSKTAVARRFGPKPFECDPAQLLEYFLGVFFYSVPPCIVGFEPFTGWVGVSASKDALRALTDPYGDGQRAFRPTELPHC